jgi:hypothetical protein
LPAARASFLSQLQKPAGNTVLSDARGQNGVDGVAESSTPWKWNANCNKEGGHQEWYRCTEAAEKPIVGFVDVFGKDEDDDSNPCSTVHTSIQ